MKKILENCRCIKTDKKCNERLKCYMFICQKQKTRKHIELYPFTSALWSKGVFISLYILKCIGCLMTFDQTFLFVGVQMCHFPV